MNHYLSLVKQSESWLHHGSSWYLRHPNHGERSLQQSETKKKRANVLGEKHTHVLNSSLHHIISFICHSCHSFHNNHIYIIYIIHLFGDGWKPWRASDVLSDQRAKCPATGLPGIDSSTNDSLMKWFHLGKWSYFTHLNLGASYGDDFPYPLVNIQKTMERSTIFNG